MRRDRRRRGEEFHGLFCTEGCQGERRETVGEKQEKKKKQTMRKKKWKKTKAEKEEGKEEAEPMSPLSPPPLSTDPRTEHKKNCFLCGEGTKVNGNGRTHDTAPLLCICIHGMAWHGMHCVCVCMFVVFSFLLLLLLLAPVALPHFHFRLQTR